MAEADATALLIPFGDSALDACVNVLRQLTPDSRDRPTPCTDFTVLDLGEHLTRSMVLLGGLAGRKLAAPPGAALTDSIASLGRAAIEAWRERGLAGEVAVGRTMTPAPLAADIITLELTVHGWDFAQAIGVEFTAEDDLCDHLLVRAAQLITDDKRGRGFAAASDAGAESTPLQRFVAFTGRPR